MHLLNTTHCNPDIVRIKVPMRVTTIEQYEHTRGSAARPRFDLRGGVGDLVPHPLTGQV